MLQFQLQAKLNLEIEEQDMHKINDAIMKRIVCLDYAKFFAKFVQADEFHLLEGRGHDLFYEGLPFWPFKEELEYNASYF